MLPYSLQKPFFCCIWDHLLEKVNKKMVVSSCNFVSDHSFPECQDKIVDTIWPSFKKILRSDILLLCIRNIEKDNKSFPQTQTFLHNLIRRKKNDLF